ncbi:MAG: hypothetical protein B7Z36_05545 [Novosphingobium sp. 12-63-9]|nr:MAG: hypothetical protein B7Z36_05545 [Novosphingobium sp. 12-63-9]
MAVLVTLAALGGFWLRRPAERPALGLFTSLPILWNEAPDMGGMIDDKAPPHWSKAALAADYRVVPLDTLLTPGTLRLLLMAQPRPLSPQENVALDGWVRGGGRLLLFADPMATRDSVFAPGDRRRPQDVALLSPILARWGLDLTFDDSQPAGLRESARSAIPVNLPGALVLRAGNSTCEVKRAGLVAECPIGAGFALIVADSAVFDSSVADADQDRVLRALARRAFMD